MLDSLSRRYLVKTSGVEEAPQPHHTWVFKVRSMFICAHIYLIILEYMKSFGYGRFVQLRSLNSLPEWPLGVFENIMVEFP